MTQLVKIRPEALDHALDCFWKVIAENYPEATSGDMEPLADREFQIAAEAIANLWLFYNHPLNLLVPVSEFRAAVEAVEETGDGDPDFPGGIGCEYCDSLWATADGQRAHHFRVHRDQGFEGYDPAKPQPGSCDGAGLDCRNFDHDHAAPPGEEQAQSVHGEMLCNHCSRPIFYDAKTGDHWHVAPYEFCFLIPFLRAPAPEPDPALEALVSDFLDALRPVL